MNKFNNPLNHTLNLETENWDMFAAEYDQHERDWQEGSVLDIIDGLTDEVLEVQE